MRKFISLMLLFLASSCLAKNTVTDYQRIYLPVYTSDGSLMIALRVFKMNDIPSFLVVNPENFATKVLPVTQLQPRQNTISKPGHYANWGIASTPYYQILNKSTAAPYTMENQGITHAGITTDKAILTADLCPSTKPFEAKFFNKLVQIADKSNQPVPITIAISGLWILHHPQEFQWLINQKQHNKLNITWANHSFSHVYYHDQPYSQNFLLAPNTNLEVEILLTEKYLLEAGETPSVFFRFPGLISDEHLIKELKKYGLIPLGADAWLAKSQPITPGAVILVHGNSNEHEGIKILLPQLDNLHLIDIKKAL
ncbi:MAG: hypothetical protein WC627_09620 [Legionella sp.]